RPVLRPVGRRRGTHGVILNMRLRALLVSAACVLGASCYQPQSKACSGGLICAPGFTCSFDGMSCVRASDQCGNGHLDQGEVCDDGNTVSGDGCSADCLSEEICGNGILDPQKNEVCDDGNTK